MDDKLIHVASQENSPLEIGISSCKPPANVLQAFHEADNDKGINVSKSAGCPKAVEVVEQKANYTLEPQITEHLIPYCTDFRAVYNLERSG